MAQKIIGAQRDFSFGEIDVTLKRADDHPARKAGLRQLANMRILNSGAAQNRPGASARFPTNLSSRVEKVTMSPGNIFHLAFGADGGNGSIRIFSATGTQVFAIGTDGSGNLLPWTLANVNQIVYAQFGLTIVITFPGLRPQVLTWDGATPTGWAVTNYTEQVVGGQKRTPFYRISPQGITMNASAQTGVIVLSASVPIFTAAHVGTRIRFVNRQVLITNVPGPYPSLTCGALVQEPLPGSQSMTFVIDPTTIFAVGDVVRGSVTGSIGQVVGIIGNPTNSVTVQLLNTNSSPAPQVWPFSPTVGSLAFTTADTMVGQGGGIVVSSASTIGVPATTQIWDEEVMNAMRGYPASVFADQFRLGLCNFPAVPNGISWSAINSPTDLYVGANASNAMFEIAPDKVQVYYVVAGPESSEFVFCDHKIYYIKIDASNPLKPGSVGFQTLSGDGSAQVQPRIAQEIILYVNAGQSSVMAIAASGAYYRPFNTKSLTSFHSHLFSNIQVIAAPTADSTFEERYAYVLNGNGTMVVGKFDLDDLAANSNITKIGWAPVSGVGTLKWISAWNADVLFTTTYFGFTLVEALDDTRYLDGSLFVNALPAAFAAPVGKGPLWWMPSQTVSLMDQSTRSMGSYQVDADGFIVPQGNAGENLLAATLVAGQPWTSTVEPFCPNAQPGADAGQRMKMRQVSYFAAYVVNSTGFLMGYLFSGRQTSASPALGTLMNFRRFTAWNQDDDPTLPPPQRETVEEYPPAGSTFDPRPVIIKDTPGPFQLLEIAIEVSI